MIEVRNLSKHNGDKVVDLVGPHRMASVSGTAKARSSSVDIAASVYVQHLHGAGIFNDAVDHPMVTSASRVQTAKLTAEGLAYSLWDVTERPEDELDAGRRHLLR